MNVNINQQSTLPVSAATAEILHPPSCRIKTPIKNPCSCPTKALRQSNCARPAGRDAGGLLAKPFSLNEAIAAEAALASTNKSHTAEFDIQNEDLDINKLKKSETFTDHILNLHRGFTPQPFKFLHNKNKKFKKATELLKPKKTISPLNYRKLFQINLPFKPKPLRLQKPRLTKQKNQSLERETTKNDKLTEKYIPLLRNLGLLFGNLLRNDDSAAHESKEINNRLYDDVSGDKDDVLCACADKSKSQSRKEAIADSSAPCAEVGINWEDQAEASTTTTHNTTSRDVSRLRQNQNIPLLLTRDTTSSERDDNGVSQGSSSTFHGSIKGNISRFNGDSQHNTGSEQDPAHTAIHGKNTNSAARDSPSSNKFDRRFGGDRNGTRSADDRLGIDITDETTETTNTTGEIGADVIGFKVKDQLSFTRDETKHPEFVRGRTRSVVPEYKVSDNTKSVQSQENYAQSVISVTKHLTSDKRFAKRSGASTPENKEVCSTDEAVISRDISDALEHDPKTTKVVMIIDGYSVTRGKIGENKLTEKSIQIS